MRQCADLLIAKTEQKTLANLCTVTSEQVPERYKTQWLFRSCRREPRRQPEKALKLTLCAEKRAVRCPKAWETGPACRHTAGGPGTPRTRSCR